MWQRLARLSLLLPACAWAATPDIDALLKQLARPAPSSTPFVEAHFSPLLSRPLLVSGQLEYLGSDALARSVQQPYQERTDIAGDTVTITRGSGRPRKFSLQRAPELKLLLGSFTALLSGNRAALEQQFSLAADGDEHHWSLQLTPLDARVHARIRAIKVEGANGEPRCLTTTEADEAVTVMLLSDAARVSPPKNVDRAWLDARCAGSAGAGPAG